MACQPPRTRAPPAPREPLDGPLQPLAPREPLDGPLQPLAPREPLAGPLRPPAPREPPAASLRPSASCPHYSKPQDRPPVSIGRPKCLTNKNNSNIYQIK
jgi:hypothetical protein